MKVEDTSRTSKISLEVKLVEAPRVGSDVLAEFLHLHQESVGQESCSPLMWNEKMSSFSHLSWPLPSVLEYYCSVIIRYKFSFRLREFVLDVRVSLCALFDPA